MGLIRLFTSFSGRIGRLAFWFGLIVIFLAGGAAASSAMGIFFSENPVAALQTMMSEMGPTQFAIVLVLLWPLTVLIVKRLHDRGKSGLLAALIWAPAVIKIAEGMTGNGFVSNYLVGWGFDLLTAELAMVGTWFFFELGFLGGTKGANRYGGDPDAA